MSASNRASRALQFMQQCRQNASSSPAHTRALYQSQPQIRRQSTVNTPSLDPESFGKKLELQIDPNDPLPEWRLAKPAEPAPSSQPPTPTRRANIDLDESNPSSFPRSRHAPIPRYKHNPAITPGLFSFIKYRVLRIPEPPNPHLSANQSFTILTNPYRARVLRLTMCGRKSRTKPINQTPIMLNSAVTRPLNERVRMVKFGALKSFF